MAKIPYFWNLFMTSILLWVRSLKCLFTNIMFGVAFPLDFNVNKISKNGNLCLVLTFWRLLKGKWVGWDNFLGQKLLFFWSLETKGWLLIWTFLIEIDSIYVKSRSKAYQLINKDFLMTLWKSLVHQIISDGSNYVWISMFEAKYRVFQFNYQ